MKKSLFTLTCLFAMMATSLSAKAQDITINLFPGWTWISYPKTEAMDIATALGDFVPVEGDIINSQYSSATYRNGQWRGRLQQFTPGLGYMYYSMRGEPVTLVFGGSTPQAQVFVTTSEPLLITAVSAMGGGEVTTEDGIFILAKGLCWATHENPTTNEDASIDAGSGVGSFSASMDGLNIATTYYVRAYAVTADGTTYGDQKTFTTRDGIPTVTTAEVTNIQGETAACGGNVTDNCGLTVTDRGICWSTSPNPTLDDSHTTNGSGMGSFSSSITGLSVSTTYYVRAYATTSAGTAYGEEVSFTTRDGIPTVTTAEVTNIGSSRAYSGGNITDDGGLAITARGVCWSTSHSPTLSDSHTTDGTGTGSFTSTLTSLTPNTTYYVRAYATNNYGTIYGSEMSFTTLEGIAGAIDGKFTINTSGDQVYFSQGNLQYIGSATTPYWKFADNQWDILSITTSQNSTSQNVDRDLFGWGTSGYNHGANCYQPWSTSTSPNDYYDYGGYTYNLYDQTGQADWGYNPISNGGNQPGQWRTLTKNEWVYVFDTRTTSSGIRYAKAKVNNVNGVILLPDDWSTSYYTLSNTNSTGARFSSNTITAEQWSTLEQHGAVFLPAAGFRNGTSVYSVGSIGKYWSASYYNSASAYNVDFDDSYLGPQYNDSRYYGCSVRLARVAE